MARIIPPSEMPVNADGSAFHLHLKPAQVADRIVMVGDPERVTAVASFFDACQCEVRNREFHSVTGNYHGKRITALSHGIGGDNIDIVMNELDALVNIDFDSRTVRPDLRRLHIVRMGTSGSIQPDLPTGAYVAAGHAIGFDGVLYFYKDSERVRDLDFEQALLNGLHWQIQGLTPYVTPAEPQWLEQICKTDIRRGVTIAANGFYGAQGRVLRLPLADAALNDKIRNFRYRDFVITNFEMESAALAGLAALMGHSALTVCCIIAGRTDKTMNTDYQSHLHALTQKVLDRI